MTIGTFVGNFSSNSTTITVSDAHDGSVVTQVNFEGTADGFGVVVSTLTFYGSEPGVDHGQVSYIGQAFPAEGSFLTGIGEGMFEEVGTHEWRIRIPVRVSNGKMILTDGIVKLKERSCSGKLYEWE